MDYMGSMIEKITIERNKKVDTLILGEIQKIAVENGIETKIILNEKAVADALRKQIPKHIEEQTEDDREFIDYVCPNCKTTLQQKMKCATRTTIYKYKHCIECGQSLDWHEEKGE